MFNFFVLENQKSSDHYFITGTDYNHIKNVLRMKIGDRFLVSSDGLSDLCEIEEIDSFQVKCKIIEKDYIDTELSTEIYLFQGLPKSEKMELIIQKCVELGANGFYPVEMEHCVVKLDEKKKSSKTERWQKIAESAAKQSKRNSIPEVYKPVSFSDALKIAKEMDLFLVPYENEEGMKATKESLSKINKGDKIGILIGPEGGFSKKEIELCKEIGAEIISLGKRILRTETAAITAVSMCMLYTEMNV